MLTGLRACVVVTAALCLVTLRASAPAPATLADALDLYARGEFAAGVSAVKPAEWNVATFTFAVQQWIDAAAPSARPRRQMFAAAFALETVWVATRTHALEASFWGLLDSDQSLSPIVWKSVPLPDPRAEYRVVAWACQQMPSSGVVSAAERWWWLASVGVLGDSNSWRGLLGLSPSETTPKDPNRLDKRDYNEGHLTHARARMPDEPRWKLNDAIARAWQTRGTRPVRHFPGRTDVLNTSPLTGGTGERAEKFLEAIAGEPTLAGEVRLRVGYIEILRRQWASALSHFDRARPNVSEPFLLAVMDYLAGWAHEQLQQSDKAETAYRRAHAIAPHVRNLSTRLAGVLFLSNQRAEAYALLDDIVKTPVPPYDLVTLLSRGDARFVPDYLTKMREALR